MKKIPSIYDQIVNFSTHLIRVLIIFFFNQHLLQLRPSS